MTKLKKLILLICTFFPSGLRLVIWRLLGMKVGRNCKVAILSLIVAEDITIEDGAIVEPFVLIYHPRSLILGARSRIAGFVRIVGYRGRVEIKRQSFIGLSTLIDLTGDFTLGERSQIAPRTMIYTHGSSGLMYSKNFPTRVGPVVIGDDCYIGMGCIIHPDVQIGNEVLIFPGLILRRNIVSSVAVSPPKEEYILQPIRRLQVLTNTEVKQGKLAEALMWLSGDLGGKILYTQDGVIRGLEMNDGRKIHLVDCEQQDEAMKCNDRDLIWSLKRINAQSSAPQFCFGELFILGERNAFSEKVATWLAENLAQFVYETDIAKHYEDK